MDRDGIERHDFPTGRRGYDPDAVHAHLRRVADEFEAMRAAPPPLSAGTSAQVRGILEAAERSAAELRAKAGEAAEGLLARLDQLERELSGLVDALHHSHERLTEGLAELQGAVSPRPAGNGDSDEAGARLIALNMALSGTPREETARYLAEHFTLADADALLDDVYARADR